MLQISREIRDEIIKVIANYVIPTNQGIQIINILNSLLEFKVEDKTNNKK